MSTDRFRNRFRIQSARANWHNYDGRAYFVTICTHGRKHYFGKIGDIRFDVGTCHHQRNTVETFHETSLQQKRQRQQQQMGDTIQIATQMQTWLSVVVRQFKQSVTRFAKKQHIPFAWQTRFHDHIIRDTGELNRIATYIENNVIHWKEERLYRSLHQIREPHEGHGQDAGGDEGDWDAFHAFRNLH